jgi:excinuclease ABC subunit A
MHDKIVIKGARQHNLKNINLEIPKNKLIVITGLSGSGKSTLAFDTVYAEGQRRYVESLSAYARQFLELMDKPDVDSIDGLSPAISIQQKTTSKNPRSTVGTVTEIYDYLRLLYARIGIPTCPKCSRTITSQSSDSITESILKSAQNKKNCSIMILAPIISAKKGTYEKLFNELKQDGFSRIRLDGVITNLEDEEQEEQEEQKIKYPRLDRQKKHTIEVIVDRLKVMTEEKSRLFESVQSALKIGNGIVIASIDGEDTLYSQRNACPYCGISIGDLEPRSFSFNSPFGACTECNGLGVKIEFDPELIIPDKSKSILDGAVKPWSGYFATFRSEMLRDVGKRFGFNLYTPISKMTEEQIKVILYGTDENIHYKHEGKYSSSSRWEFRGSFEGVIPNLERLYKQTESESKREDIMQFMRERTCDSCLGRRLRREALSVKIQEKSIMDICDLSIDNCYQFFRTIELSETERYIARTILKEIISRLEFLNNVGLNYLSLNRVTATLSGGESQRIRLATQVGSNLTGVLYVLDEPTIGLHQRDNAKLIDTLKKLRDLDNTLLVVEHDEEVIRNSDWIIDIGPGAGVHGGEITAYGRLENILDNKNSVTAAFLRGDKLVSYPKQDRKVPEGWLTIYGAQENNLKSIDVQFPIGCMTVVTGVSGSGKSTLVNDILFKALAGHIYNAKEKPGKHRNLSGLEYVDKVIGIDQSPIGRTPRSNAATYVNAFTPIRELFAKTSQAKEMGYKSGRFSFNVSQGRCEACQGGGVRKIEMQFLPDVYVTCDECKGKRYNSETLTIKYKGKTISDVLNMTVDEASEFFENISIIEKKLRTLKDVGLGYIRLGQPATTLSGGEAQRIKLAAELSKRDTGKTVYILDEPTTGLHFADVSKLLHVLKRLEDLGNTIIVIEHNLDVIISADWIIDLGPEGGEGGGKIVITGTPHEVAENKDSHTGKYLKPKLALDQIIPRSTR